MKNVILTGALALLAGASFAWTGVDEGKNVAGHYINITSVTVPRPVPMDSRLEQVSLFLIGGAANQSVTINTRDARTSAVLTSETVAVNAATVVSRTYGAPLFFNELLVSVTTSMGNNSISGTVIQAPVPFYGR